MIVKPRISGKIPIVFRYDDYSSISPTEIEKQIIELFRRYNYTCVFGIIPFVCCGNQLSSEIQPNVPLTVEKIEMLKMAIRDMVVEPALHGYTHQTAFSLINRRPSEFNDLDIKTQKGRLTAGLEFLHTALGVPIRVFIPPWNTYDANTLHALEALGFLCISAGQHTGVALEQSDLCYLPNTCGMMQVPAALTSARQHQPEQAIITVMLHPYDFFESNAPSAVYALSDLAKTLEWIAKQPDVFVTGITTLCSNNVDLGAQRYQAGLKINRQQAIFPPHFRRWFQLPIVYLPLVEARQFGQKRLAALLLFYSLFGGVSAAAVNLFAKWLAPWNLANLANLVLTYAAIMTMTLTLTTKTLKYRRLLLAVAFSGAALGCWISTN